MNIRRTDYQGIKKSDNSSLRLTKSYYLYNNNNLKNSSKLHMGSDSFTNNLNTNNINLSTKYNNRYNNKPTDSKDFYKSNSNNKFFSSSGLKFNEKIKLISIQ